MLRPISASNKFSLRLCSCSTYACVAGPQS
jgi:hypothetical protein